MTDTEALVFVVDDDASLRASLQDLLESVGLRVAACASAQEFPHSIGLRGGGCQHASQASRGEDLEIEEPVACRHFSAFHFHPTVAGMPSPTLIWREIVQMG